MSQLARKVPLGLRGISVAFVGSFDCLIYLIVIMRFSCSTVLLASSSTLSCLICARGYACCRSLLIPLMKHLWRVPSSILASVDSRQKAFENSGTLSRPCLNFSVLFWAVPSASGLPNWVCNISSSLWYVVHVLSFFPSANRVSQFAAGPRNKVSINVILVRSSVIPIAA